jgi:hypothetical protein
MDICGISTAVTYCLDVDYGPKVTNSHSTLLSFYYARILSELSVISKLLSVTGILLQRFRGPEDRYIRIGVLKMDLHNKNCDEMLTLPISRLDLRHKVLLKRCYMNPASLKSSRIYYLVP